jgi:hypothetical protein
LAIPLAASEMANSRWLKGASCPSQVSGLRSAELTQKTAVMLAGSMSTRIGRPQKDRVDRERPYLWDALRVERLEESAGLLGLVFDPACDVRVVGPIIG